MHANAPTTKPADPLSYPFETAPQPDEVIEIRPGVLWVRLALPFRLNHVNIYLLRDGDGWAMVDAGFGNEETIAAWTKLFEGPLKGVTITRLIVTHAHPDHVGLAGWIVERFGCPLLMSQVEYLQSAYHQHRGSDERKLAQRLFFRRHGMDEDLTDQLLGRGQEYLQRVSTLPASYRRLSKDDEITIGTRRFKVITGGGHALDQVMLYCADDKLFLSADQVLSKISPNVSVWAVEPDANSLGDYLTSLAELDRVLPDDVLVLPGHGIPFFGVKIRIKQLADHHEERCRMIADACRAAPKTSAQLVPVVFNKHKLDAHQTGFAAGELIAHVNHMLAEGRLTVAPTTDGVLRFATA
ncbi:MBL fold metallo-hydrolase [Bradyrhizobium sp. U87765 SZCCT0131]|uniref:MBL fold metallo-hydrolase n=1 Tax=unclassified Bradyrhizobium TaxID=2631580 RepID=UPI001BA821D1|nr:MULTISPECIES: MBL fold metallo-hydrolase [unclassified Bradyrhizobium]MBR1220971.1 MBL fold metallo-hydrolase [Bradyrhizobium sp. U87765 SZCCT0131]MBR1260209.1 MBL fold metallo-hydrolase [Bradyrhizobium sp. U87765 SZCCT0134]MBR1307542.1 MBL fold metallo-hydrolase [Bradyrhizobium sp. U87765 SZCCT0110]MBR1321496.1 MBL fold metallo-hydrolase [Bradyrhizobium sp. U87765 SZCCT0109]MBR1349809.1 MBL fold metallo-hydrolase [Bradyrhizobium sp. U87765 SZCCT0048]